MTDCPLLPTLWLESPMFRDHLKRMGMTYADACRTQLHVHHIFGGKTRKDLPSNTITICGAVHDFCHTHQTEGRIACLWWKAMNNQLRWTEADVAAGHTAIERLSVAVVSSPFREWNFDLRHDYEAVRHATAQ